MRCVQGMSVTTQDYKDKQLHAHSRHQVCHVIVGFHVLCVDLGFHVVIGVGRLTVQKEGFIRQLHFTTHTQFQVQKSFLLDVVVRLCPAIVNSICIPNSCIFHITKTGLLRCCLHKLRCTTVFQHTDHFLHCPMTQIGVKFHQRFLHSFQISL